nr:putative ribonuclease H-like domain-containing protein [Tanacetum cinerariifolium]
MVTLGRLLPHARGLRFKPRRGGFPSGAKKEWGLSPKAKVRVLHTAQLDVTVEDFSCFSLFVLIGICITTLLYRQKKLAIKQQNINVDGIVIIIGHHVGATYDVGAEADFNNLETSITVSPIPTTRIHKDHPSAFLYGTIEEEVYVCQPLGFEDPDHADKVYKVVKALYDLNQAPRAWYETLANYLLENGFQGGKIDQT